jgi:uncharacterized membrane protein
VHVFSFFPIIIIIVIIIIIIIHYSLSPSGYKSQTGHRRQFNTAHAPCMLDT